MHEFRQALARLDFSAAESYLGKRFLADDSSYKCLMAKLELLEAKEAFFRIITAISDYIAINVTKLTPEEKQQLIFRRGYFALRAGKILLAESDLLNCLEQGLNEPSLKMHLGHVYKAKGDSQQAASYYREFITDNPKQSGSGYWSLADLKDHQFNQQDLVAMNLLFNNKALNLSEDSLLLFAIARAHEQAKSFPASFSAMQAGNNLVAQQRPFQAQLYAELIKKAIQSQLTISKPDPSAEFKPIFIVGMPRSGTTLVEQILASHSLVDSSDELPFIERIGLELEKNGGYYQALNKLTETQRASYADSYQEQIQQYFEQYQAITIDKNPNNFLHIGLIKQLFPHAKIINLIRDPLDNAMSVFKQYFANGHDYSYSLQGIAFYWQGYLELMHHWKKCYPGEILQLGYEKLVASPEQEIRRLLKYCELDYEIACERFYESDRMVLTPSVSQVRQPINNRSVQSWKKYQAQLTSALATFERIKQKANLLLK